MDVVLLVLIITMDSSDQLRTEKLVPIVLKLEIHAVFPTDSGFYWPLS